RGQSRRVALREPERPLGGAARPHQRRLHPAFRRTPGDRLAGAERDRRGPGGPTMTRRTLWLAIACAGGLALGTEGGFQAEAVPVEPAELERRADLIGREVLVDDRVEYYVRRSGTEDDELQLKRTPVTF